MQKQAVFKIYGKVQGVFFRDSSKKKADNLNLSGWVRNEPDGTVKIVAEGDKSALKELLEWCKEGPDHAKVEKVDVKWLDFTGELDNFYIK